MAKDKTSVVATGQIVANKEVAVKSTFERL